MIARPAPDNATVSLTDLLDATAAPAGLRGLYDDDDPLEAALADGGDVPPAAWDAALLGPARDMLARPGKGFRGELVRLGFRLAGGSEMPAALPALVELIHAGSLVIDDVEDDSARRRGAACLHRIYGVPLAVNVGNWLYFWPLELVDTLGLPAPAANELRRLMGRAMFRCHYGQALDLSVQIGRVPQRWIPPVVARATALKTGTLLELAAAVGAVAAGASPDRIATLARFGRRMGIGLQMLDDLGNLAPRAPDAAGDDKHHEDLRLARPSWPWAWAARDLDQRAFAALQGEARVIQARALAGHHPDTETLAAALRTAVGLRGRRTTRVLLERAMGDLESHVGPAPELRRVRDELARLEAAYG